MSNSKYEYVKDFEIHNELIKNTFIVLRIDGKGFTKFCDLHKFEKPNDRRGIEIMVLAGLAVMESFDEIFMAYGQSDEFSFVFRKDAELYNRRSEKILTNVVSTFSASYVFYWNKIFPNTPLKTIPGFDGRIVLYPSYRNLRDYFSWRQVDCHINNLYNTTFWALVHLGNLSNEEAHKKLMKTFSKDKNEILFSQFNINYNFLPEVYKKGTTLYRNNFSFDLMSEGSKSKKGKKEKEKKNKKNKINETNEIFGVESKEEELLKHDLNNLHIKEQQIKEIEIREKDEKDSNNAQQGSEIKIKSDKDEEEKFKNPMYQFSFSDNFLEIYEGFKEKNIEISNEDIIKDDFWLKKNFVFKKSEENFE